MSIQAERWWGWIGKCFALVAILLLTTLFILGPYRHNAIMHALYGKTNQGSSVLYGEEKAMSAAFVSHPDIEGCGCPLCCPASKQDL